MASNASFNSQQQATSTSGSNQAQPPEQINTSAETGDLSGNRIRSNVPIPRPFFAGSEDENPDSFIKKLRRYIQQFTPDYQVLQAIEYFSGTASNWANGIGASETNFPAFDAAFVRDYLGTEASRQIR